MGWYNKGWQDGVRLQALERLDLVDALAFQDLVYSQMQEMFGALMGLGSGATTSIETTGTNTGAGVGSQFFCDVGACQFYYSFPARRSDGTLIGGGVTRGFFVTHDPQDSGQLAESHIDVTAYVAVAQAAWNSATQTWNTPNQRIWDTPAILPWLWARPVLVAGDLDARRDWDTVNQIEKSISIDTRQRTRVSFQLATTDPNDQIPDDVGGVPTEQPWVKIGRVLSWVNGTEYDPLGGPEIPIIHPLSAWDGSTNSGWIVDNAQAPSLAEFTGDPGESSYQGTSANAGTIGAPETGAEEQYGRAPALGHTSGFSPFVHPELQAATPAEIAGADGIELTSDYGYVVAKRPRHAGLISHNHLVRDRLKRHMFGVERTETDYWDSSPWYGLGLRGIHDISHNEARIDTLENNVNNNDSDILELQGRLRLIACGAARITSTHSLTPTWTVYEPLSVGGVYVIGPEETRQDSVGTAYSNPETLATVRIRLSTITGTPRYVIVNPARNVWQGTSTSPLDPNGGFGIDRQPAAPVAENNAFGGFCQAYRAVLYDFFYDASTPPVWQLNGLGTYDRISQPDGVQSFWNIDIQTLRSDAGTNDPLIYGSFDFFVYGV